MFFSVRGLATVRFVRPVWQHRCKKLEAELASDASSSGAEISEGAEAQARFYTKLHPLVCQQDSGVLRLECQGQALLLTPRPKKLLEWGGPSR